MATAATRDEGAADLAARYRVAVLVPCYNEEAAVAKVVADFRAALPAPAILCLRQ